MNAILVKNGLHKPNRSRTMIEKVRSIFQFNLFIQKAKPKDPVCLIGTLRINYKDRKERETTVTDSKWNSIFIYSLFFCPLYFWPVLCFKLPTETLRKA